MDMDIEHDQWYPHERTQRKIDLDSTCLTLPKEGFRFCLVILSVLCLPDTPVWYYDISMRYIYLMEVYSVHIR